MSKSLPAPVWLLIVGTFAIHLGSYTVIPYLMVLLPQSLAVTTLTAGALVFVVKLSVKGSSIVGGPLADRLGTRRLMVVGLLLRAVGMAAFAITQQIGWLFTFSAVAGLGSGFYAPATRGAIGHLTPPPLRKEAFSLRAVAANLGMAVAPAAVFLLAGFGVKMLFWTSSAVFAVLALLTWRWLPDMPALTSEPLAVILRDLAHDRRWLAYGALIVGSWSLYGHLDTNVMVWANSLGGLGGMTGLAALYALLVAVLQTPVTRLLGARLNSWSMVTAGTGVTSLALVTVGLADGVSGAIAGITLFAVGATLLVPGADLVTSDMAAQGRVNTYFGSASLFSTLGMSLSAPLGAALIEVWGPVSPTPWFLLGCVGLALTVVLGFAGQGLARPHPDDDEHGEQPQR